jgi:hypothetical protein
MLRQSFHEMQNTLQRTSSHVIDVMRGAFIPPLINTEARREERPVNIS